MTAADLAAWALRLGIGIAVFGAYVLIFRFVGLAGRRRDEGDAIWRAHQARTDTTPGPAPADAEAPQQHPIDQ